MKVCRLVVHGSQDRGVKALVWSFLQGKIEDPFNDQVRVEVDGVQCMLEILDTTGHEEYSALLDAWIRDGQGFVLVYSITSQSTFNDLTQFHQRILHIKDTEKVPMVLVGNNCELEDDRIVTKEQGSSLALQWGIPFFEISTRNSINVDQVFFELVRQIIRNDQRVDPIKATNADSTPFLVACEIGNLEDVKSMLKDKRFDVNERDVIGESPFYDACLEGDLEIVRLLLNDNRIDVNKADKNGATPFYMASQEGNIEIVKLLLNDKVDVDETNNNGESPFFIACQNGHIEIVNLLLNNERIDVNKTDIFGQTPFYTACEKGQIEIVKLLLNDNRIDINKVENSDWTPFHTACSRGYIEIVKYILASEREVNLSAKNKNRKTAMDIAKESGKENIVELLKSFQKNPNLTRIKLRNQL